VAAIDERLKTLGIVLPDVMPPVVDGYVPAFAPFIRSGDYIHLSGRQVPFGACVEIDMIAELRATQLGGSNY
jgi:hypothetical protein